MPKCPRCGEEVPEEANFCTNCGFKLEGAEEGIGPESRAPRMGAMGHLNLGFQLASKKPMVFAPALLGSLISIIISRSARGLLGIYRWEFWPGWPAMPPYRPETMSLILFSGLLGIIGFIVSYILYFASIDMSRDAYFDAPLSLTGSVNYVLRRIGIFIVASIVGAIMSITIILIPAVLLMFVVMVVDETGIGDSLSKAFSVLTRELGDVIVLIVVSILGSIILGFIPFVGGLLQACLRVVIGLAFIDLYYLYKKQSRI